MTKIEVRQLREEEWVDVTYAVIPYSFQSTPPLPDKASVEQEIQQSRQRGGVTWFALFEDARPLSVAGGCFFTQQVRGALYRMGGIFGVASHPSARRKGYIRQVMAGLLAGLREQGGTLSCLYPFRESFYQRMGYVTFPQPRRIVFNPSALAPLLKKDLGGTVERVPISDGYKVYRDYLKQKQQHVHGMAIREKEDLAWAQRNEFWLALAKTDAKQSVTYAKQSAVNGELVGLMMYNIKGKEDEPKTLNVYRFFYDTSQGKYLLLEWIARHADQTNRAVMTLPPFETPETWQEDFHVAVEPTYEFPMARVLDVAKIGGMRTGPGSFAARITDPLCPWNKGTWRFSTEDGVLKVHPAEGADCELSIQALSALIYGTVDAVDFAIRGWGNPSPEVQNVLRSMFTPRLPFLHEMF